MQSGSILQRSSFLVEVDLYDGWIALGTAVTSGGYAMSTFRKKNDATTQVAVEFPLGEANRVQDERAFTLWTSTDSLVSDRVLACGMRTERTRHAWTGFGFGRSIGRLRGSKECVYAFEWRRVVAVWAQWKGFPLGSWNWINHELKVV